MNTDLENRMEDWITDHLGYCGTCLYKIKGRCTNEESSGYDEKVPNKCSCAEWMPEKGLHV